jgi:hypothetical protein
MSRPEFERRRAYHSIYEGYEPHKYNEQTRSHPISTLKRDVNDPPTGSITGRRTQSALASSCSTTCLARRPRSNLPRVRRLHVRTRTCRRSRCYVARQFLVVMSISESMFDIAYQAPSP